jgi:hypothetical protein
MYRQGCDVRCRGADVTTVTYAVVMAIAGREGPIGSAGHYKALFNIKFNTLLLLCFQKFFRTLKILFLNAYVAVFQLNVTVKSLICHTRFFK